MLMYLSIIHSKSIDVSYVSLTLQHDRTDDDTRGTSSGSYDLILQAYSV